jgi:serine phosphatase RsbU (regulator of sigma subunit)
MSGLAVGLALAIALSVVWALVTITRNRHTTTAGAHDTLVEFAEQSLELGSVLEILGFAGSAARIVLGAERAVALVATDGEWEAHPIEGESLGKVPAVTRGLFSWLRHNPSAVVADDLEHARFGAMRQPMRQLLEFTGADVLLPLVDRQELIAVLALRRSKAGHVERDVLTLFQEQTTTSCANARLHVEASHAFSLAREVSLASAFHESLVAASPIGAAGPLAWAGDVEAAGDAGSDFWSMYPLAGGRVLVIIGDSVGAGLAGSMTSAVVKSACDLLVTGEQPLEDPAALLSTLSRALARASAPVHARCFAALFDPANHAIRYANAGGQLPYRVHPDGRLEALPGGGPMLGDAFESTYKVHDLALAAGDALVMSTDGLVKAENPGRVQFGDRRLQKLLTASAGRVAESVLAAILAAVRAHRAGHPLGDDAAVVVVTLAA